MKDAGVKVEVVAVSKRVAESLVVVMTSGSGSRPCPSWRPPRPASSMRRLGMTKNVVEMNAYFKTTAYLFYNAMTI